jgi:hypothetical protein
MIIGNTLSPVFFFLYQIWKCVRFRVIRVNLIRPLQRQPLAEEFFLTKNRAQANPISMSDLLTFFEYVSPFSNYQRKFNPAATKAPSIESAI